MTFSTNYSVVDLDKTNEFELSMAVPFLDAFDNDIYLKSIPNSIIFTKEELEARDRRVAAEAWDNAEMYYMDDGPNPSPPNKETYLNSLKL